MNTSNYILPFKIWALQMGLTGEEAKKEYKKYVKRQQERKGK